MPNAKAVGGKPPAVPRNERALQTQVLKFLKLHGGFWENRSPGHFGSTGVPDITGVYAGRFVAIELKHPREHGPKADDKRWPAQRRYLKNVALHNGMALATNNLAAVEALIRYLDVLAEPEPFYTEDWA